MEEKVAISGYGLRVVVRKYPTHLAYCAVSVDCGTRDEPQSKSGMVHFMEHMLFKGTSRRGVRSINNRLESEGGELNAYTSKEDLVLHSTVIRPDFRKAVDLMIELLFDSVYPEKEMTKERGVVVEEINSYRDTPSEAIYDEFEEHVFKGHDLSKPILGTVKSLRRIGRDDMLEFADTHFTVDNMVLTVIADISETEVVAAADRAIEKYCKRRMYRDVLTGKKDDISGISWETPHNFRYEIQKRIHQGHAVAGTRACSLYDDGRVPLSLFVNMLGGAAASSRLNQVLREKMGLVYNIEANYTPFKDCGLFTVYFGCDKANMEKCTEAVVVEMEKFADRVCSEPVLRRAKKQYLGQVAISNDNLESQVLGMGKSVLVYGRVNGMDEIRERIESVTAEQLRCSAEQMLFGLNWLIYK